MGDTPLPEGLTEDEEACAAAAMGFLGDLGGTFLATELIVFNFSVGYAGTLDLWHCADDGTTSIIDYKSSKGIYPDHGVQQAAYANQEKLWRIFQAAAFIKGWQLDTDSYRGRTPREEVYEKPIHLEA